MIIATGYLVMGLLSAAIAIPLSGNIPGDLRTDVHYLSSNQAQGLSRRAGWNLFGASKTWKFVFIEGEKGGTLNPNPQLLDPNRDRDQYQWSQSQSAENIVGELLREFSLQKDGTLPRIVTKNRFPYTGIETVYFKVTGPPECKTPCYGDVDVDSLHHENPMGHITRGDLRLKPKTNPIWSYKPKQPEPSTQWTIHIDAWGEEMRLKPKKLYMEYVISVFLREFWLKQPGNLDVSKNHVGMPALVFERDLSRFPHTQTTLFKVSGPPECKPTCFGELDTKNPVHPSGETWGVLKLPSKVVYDNSDQVKKPSRRAQEELHPTPLAGYGQEPLQDQQAVTDCLNKFFQSPGVLGTLDARMGSRPFVHPFNYWPIAQKTHPAGGRFLVHFAVRSDNCRGECTGVISIPGSAGNICNARGEVMYTTIGERGADIPIPPDCRVHYTSP
ncbi:hypothetical protein F5890DRAFT_1567280 [Lentinula detonsa]|uniref:Uncharacterized protein n=1 Tax=Lentinula detonsa TaxID=2804962 RepID=A0AA38PW66_9AGAR|nr:hypothetical protein F5890DRAFT_1567280 [Lentinula detonsa]